MLNHWLITWLIAGLSPNSDELLFNSCRSNNNNCYHIQASRLTNHQARTGLMLNQPPAPYSPPLDNDQPPLTTITSSITNHLFAIIPLSLGLETLSTNVPYSLLAPLDLIYTIIDHDSSPSTMIAGYYPYV